MRLVALIGAAIALLTTGPPAWATAPGAAPLTVHRLPHGLRVVVKDTPGSGLVAAALLIGAAPRFEEPDQAGISVLVREVALRGTTSRTAEQITGVMESVGGSLRALTGVDNTQWATLTRPQHVDLALELIADLVTNASFAPRAVESQRRISLSRLRQQQDSPQSRAVDLSLSNLYRLHPYGTPILGTAESIERLTRDRLVSYYQTYYTAPNMVLAIAGDLRAPVALAKAARAFAGLRHSPVPRRVGLLRVVEPALTPRPSVPVEVREPQRTAAAWIAISYLGVRIGHRDWAPLQVLTTILGGGSSSRLFLEIRDRQGLVYSIGAGFSTRAAAAPLLVSAGTDPGNAPRVIRGMLDEIERLRTAPASPEELVRGRNRVVGLLSIDQEDLRQQAFYAAWYELLGVGPSFPTRLAAEIGRVSAADVQRVARLYLANATVAVVLPPGQ
ncbi:MAG TPA: pitrilysin family protein [bacterium]|nr:pitrilysin family protein [bacterium]